MRYRNNDPYFTTAKFPSICAETGREIKRGEEIAYYPQNKKAFCSESKQASELRQSQFNQAWQMQDADY